MLKMIGGIIAGFLVWSLLWVGSDAVLSAIWTWYGNHQKEFEAAVLEGQPFRADSLILILALLRSVIFSLIAGMIAAKIARNSQAALFAGILLFLFGIFVQSIYWNYVPLWYHALFLISLVPLTYAGGKLFGRN